MKGSSGGGGRDKIPSWRVILLLLKGAKQPDLEQHTHMRQCLKHEDTLCFRDKFQQELDSDLMFWE
jgi:hypothetical protein